MRKGEGACLVCGKPLWYEVTEREMICVSCGKTAMSNASCEEGHYICDTCHSERAIESIMEYCRCSTSIDPIQMAQEMMDDPYVHMHGNEHHVLVGAALLRAYHNGGGSVDFEAALAEMKLRGSQYPGGACGFWGCCGAAVSTGMFLSIVTGTTPLSGRSWGLANQITAKTLERIGDLGGPRCCKRNTFTAIKTAVEFVEAHYAVKMTLPQTIQCRYDGENKQCIKRACPYHEAE